MMKVKIRHNKIIKLLFITIFIILLINKPSTALTSKSTNFDEMRQELLSSDGFDIDPKSFFKDMEYSIDTHVKKGAACIHDHQNTPLTKDRKTSIYSIYAVVDLNFKQSTYSKPGTFVRYTKSSQKTYTMQEAKKGKKITPIDKAPYKDVYPQISGEGQAKTAISALGYAAYYARNENENTDDANKSRFRMMYFLSINALSRNSDILPVKLNTGNGGSYSREAAAHGDAIVEILNYANSAVTYKFDINKSNRNYKATNTRPADETKAYVTYNEENDVTYVGPYFFNYTYEWKQNKLKIVDVKASLDSYQGKIFYTLKRDGNNLKSFEDKDSFPTGSDNPFYIAIKGKLKEKLDVTFVNEYDVCKARIIFGASKTDETVSQERCIFKTKMTTLNDAVTVSMEGGTDTKLHKIGYDPKTGEQTNLEGVLFIFQNMDTRKYIAKDGGETSRKSEAYKIPTDPEGMITLPDLEGNYCAYEVDNPDKKYDGAWSETEGIKLEIGTTTTIVNTPGAIELQLQKVDGDTGDPIEGVVFKIKENTKGWYTGNIDEPFSNNEDDASTYITDINGITKVPNLPSGDYSAVEISTKEPYEIIKGSIPLDIAKKPNVIQNFKNDEPQPPPEEVPDRGEGLVKVFSNTNNMAPMGGIQFGIKNWEPDNPEYKIEPREPLRSDSKYWSNVPHTGRRPTEKKDENGNTIYESYTYYEWEFTEELLYQSDHKEYEIKLDNYKYYMKSKETYVATGTSQTNGTVQLSGDIRPGTYDLYEYGSLNSYVIVQQKCVQSGYRVGDSLDVENPRTYVDIEGNVWVDYQEGKSSTRDNKFASNEGLNGVKVTLKRGNSEICSVASGFDSNGASQSRGHYKFWGDINNLRIEVDHLDEYSIEFSYNGIVYQSISATSIEPGGTAKAKENDSERTQFNADFSTVTAGTQTSNGQSTNLSRNNGKTILYNSTGHSSRVVYKATQDAIGTLSDEAYADDQYHMKAYTTEAGLNLGSPNQYGGYPYDPAKNSITDINCGLFRRDSLDLAIASDLLAVETSINGYSNIYEYNKRYAKIANQDAFEINIKESDIGYNETLLRELYPEDIDYTSKNHDAAYGNMEENGLNVFLTYKVVVRNQSSTLSAKVNELVEYFSSDIKEVVAVGGYIDENMTNEDLQKMPIGSNGRRYQVKNTSGFSVENTTQVSGIDYKKSVINTEGLGTIQVGDAVEFYIQVRMDQESFGTKLNQDSSGNTQLRNVVELYTCTAYDKNGNLCPAIDSDSAVGNCIPNNIDTMEDDTDFAPTVVIQRSGSIRKISGTVFEDQTSEALKAGEERLGDGVYGSGDTPIDGIRVDLIDIDRGIIAHVYEGGEVKDATKITADGGKYEIQGFIPGNYVIRYTYGNGTGKYTAQQYKSTVFLPDYSGVSTEGTIVASKERKDYYEAQNEAKTPSGTATYWGSPEWYKDNVSTQCSDAVDNYSGEMEAIDSTGGHEKYYRTPRTDGSMSRTEIEELWSNGYADGYQHILANTEIDKTININAYTPWMGFSVQYDYDWIKSGDGNLENFTVENVDFGISERPRCLVQIDKEIKRIQILNSDGSILRDLTSLEKDTLPQYTKTEPKEPIQQLKETGSDATPNRGFVEFEIDRELLQNPTILVEYEFTATNKSEVDYKDEEYYKYGVSSNADDSTIMNLSVVGVIDYVDNQVLYNKDSNMISEGNDTKTNEENGWSVIDLSKAENKKYLQQNVLDNLYDSTGCKFNTVLIGKGLDKLIKPAVKTESIGLVLNKDLQQNDIWSYENIAEIVEVKKTWGRELHAEDTSTSYGEKLGNLDPTEDMDDIVNPKNNPGTPGKEPDTSYTERIIINPPTGQDRNYTYIAIIIITLLGLLATGIIIIKKKVLK